MKRDEVFALSARLTELSHYYDRKAPNADALRVWMDCLEGQAWPDVAAVLTDWPKSRRTFPTGDEVRKLAANLFSDRLEAESRRDKALTPTVDKIVAVAQDTPNARAFKRMWTALRSKKVATPREWCNNVLASDKADGELKAFAAASLESMGAEKPRKGKYWFEEA